MDLCYLWIKEYKGLKNAEFNFSNEFSFNKVGNIININKIKGLENFFGNNIINLTAIIGENGSGKSNTLELIYKILSDGISKKDKVEFIIIFRNSLEYNTYSKCKEKIFLNTSKVEGYEKNFNKSIVLETNLIKQNLNLIFFSNVFDNRKNGTALYKNSNSFIRKLLDNGVCESIATNDLLASIRESDEYYDDRSAVEILHDQEFGRQINFAGDFYNKKLKNIKINEDIKIPKYVQIGTIAKEISLPDYYLGEQNEIFYKIYNEYIKKIIDDKYESFNFENEISKSCIENYFKEIVEEQEINKMYYSIDKKIECKWEKFESQKRGFELCKEILYLLKMDLDIILKEEIWYECEKNIKQNAEEKKEWYEFKEEIKEDIEEQKRLLDNNIKLIESISEIYKSEYDGEIYGNSYKIDFEKYNNQVMNIFKLHKLSYWNFSFLIFEWCHDDRTFSSGENAILNLFSRFYDVYKNKKITKDSLLIIMDEPEEYFHPEWQRNLINIIVDFFQTIFKEYTIQIIITSNSPFLISDLPKQNIIFLKEGKVCYRDEFRQTFGANIHTLLTKSFFMKNTIGEFANQKIKEVVKDLNEKTKEEILKINGRREEIEYIIDNIGEPVIKRKIESMYRAIFEKDIGYYHSKIKELQEEKAQLEKILKDKGLEEIDNVMKLLNNAIEELKSKVDDKND
ncbi:AAA family ATPase [Clostridium botulinum]|nr:AAA family ATPase [Clostridium botulinum]APC85728.1 AAA domain protein [Clostridium botulinum]AXG94635.1 hypothetical protein AGE31_02660 [Clostridium botulinum]EDT81366.1 conserved hypothetical protein [Clostridium botulinum NCTC 2916]EKO1911966.1 AAA family ATPase [Clostridium botulinum]EKO2042027.1 AAA family ATPase [Clostridium botulinum]